MGANPTHSQTRFLEAHDLILRAWTEPGPFEYAGKHFHFKYVNPWPLPYQKPHPPIWIPSQGSSDTIEWTAKMKYTYCQTFSPSNVVARFFDMYREQAEENGYQAGDEQLGWAFPMYVGETDKKARDDAKPHVEAMFNSLLNLSLDALLPPGYTSTASLKRIREAKVVGQKKTIDELMEAGVVLVGGPETVRQKLAEYRKQVRFDNALLMTQCGTMPNAMARANIDAIAEEILPHFQDK
jgi:alkanesulfonate monooxygenase SsuD/methylene tetrahydromethanopterin reductase-like flavin-dependent oxidoreductase (luciferase family)